MVEQDKLKYIWDNINLIYLTLGRNYRADFSNIQILSSDNYFKCLCVCNKFVSLDFLLEKEFSFVNPPKYRLHSSNFNIDDIIDILKPIFRDFKIHMISE